MGSNEKWTFSYKIFFYFSFLFLGLNIFPFPFNITPVINGFVDNFIAESFWNPIVQFTGRIFFGINEVTSRPNGSGDTTWNWLQEFNILIISTIGTIIWAVVAKNKDNHKKIHYWFNIFLRYYLALIMLSYGFSKVFPLQFGNITTYRLYERLGEMSPMGLLWTFMAYSQGYQFFGGIAEVIGGLLLLFRRTTTLGAIICVGVLINIFALNIFYDVPVKIYSFWLMLIGVYLIIEDFKRLWKFFVLNQATESKVVSDFSDKKMFKIGRIILKSFFIVGICGMMFYESWQQSKNIDLPKTAIYGPYKVEKFERSNTISDNNMLRWQEVFIDRRGAYDILFVTNESGLRTRISYRNNTKTHQLFITDYTSANMDTTHYAFSYIQADSSSLALIGKFKNDSMKVSMRKMTRDDFLLNSRGFHWINEVPFNK